MTDEAGVPIVSGFALNRMAKENRAKEGGMMEYAVCCLPTRNSAAEKLLNELAAEGWRVVAATELRVIMCRKPGKEE